MARQPQNPDRNPNALAAGQSNAQASAQPDDDEPDEPTVDLAQTKQTAPARPALSAEEQIKALQDQINALTIANLPPVEPDIIPGNTIRPVRGMLHPSGTPIFNTARPTGRTG